MSQNNESEFERLVREGKLDGEKAKKQVIDMWNKGGLESPVRVTPTQPIDSQSVRGYITQEKFIKGKTPQEMEKILGLESGKLENGATIYRLTETPKADQFTPKGYSQTPGGRPYESGGKYPPGEGVPQWELNEDVPAEVVGKVGYEEPWVEKPVQNEENNSQQSQNNKPASKTVDQVGQQAEKSSSTTAETGQDEDYYQSYGY